MIRSVNEVLARLRSLADPRNREGMIRFAVANESALGVSTPVLKKLAREIGRDQALAEALWKTGVFEARALAALIGEPEKVTEDLMERWVKDFDSWAICDGCCLALFGKTRWMSITWITTEGDTHVDEESPSPRRLRPAPVH